MEDLKGALTHEGVDRETRDTYYAKERELELNFIASSFATRVTLLRVL
jgi:hypothetical protein